MSVSTSSQVAKEAGSQAVEVGRVFGQGGTDGLILYALILAAFLLFLALVFALWLNHRERTRTSAQIQAMTQAFAEAADKSAEAQKDLATAVASAASADMTFKQTIAPLLGLDPRTGQAVDRIPS